MCTRRKIRKERNESNMNGVVIIPAFEPDEKLISIVEKVWSLGNQVIVVDDGSSECCQDIFHTICEFAIVIHHERNLGKGAAIKTALRYIEKEVWEIDVVGIMDADGQHLPEDMEKLILRARNRKLTLVLGVRELGKDMPLKSRLGNKITRKVFHMCSGVKISDTQTGLRAFDRNLIGRMLSTGGERYEYETNVLFLMAKEGIPIEEVKIHTIYHDKTNSCSHFNIIKDSIRIYRDIIKFIFFSISSFVLDYALFCAFLFVLPRHIFTYYIANILARIVSGYYNYNMNTKYVFREKKSVKTALKYSLLAIGILGMNTVLLSFYSIVMGNDVYMAKILTEATLFIISFLVQKGMIYKDNLCRIKRQEF